MATNATKKSSTKKPVPKMAPKTVDDYVAAAPKDKRAALMKLRETVKAAAPKATEGMRYGIVGFMHNGEALIHFGYWKDHFALYGGFDAHAAELRTYDKSGKGTLRLPADKPLPYGLVTKLVKARIAEIEEAG